MAGFQPNTQRHTAHNLLEQEAPFAYTWPNAHTTNGTCGLEMANVLYKASSLWRNAIPNSDSAAWCLWERKGVSLTPSLSGFTHLNTWKSKPLNSLNTFPEAQEKADIFEEPLTRVITSNQSGSRETRLIVTLPDKNPDEDISPKPTIFFPSTTEVKLHDAGTYLCLLEDFFPDVITIDWKEKNGKTVLQSQHGNTVKTKDTYMKYTWLTVPKMSMDKEHKCIVKHERNRGGVAQEILFPSINKGLAEAKQSVVDPQGRSDTRRNTGVVTVSPVGSLSSSPVTWAAELTAINSTKAFLRDEN
ncbi:uncharacterized protein LOC120225671, partial [Hyaena hyaena]|uniref:uncharacterized protein LOC120225671 n=1 Tax=Hyaena hyaena TaxID=95912 RepID=UPI001921FE7D